MSKQLTLIQAGLEKWRRFDTSLIDWYELSSWPSGIRLAALTIFSMIFLSLSGFVILGNKISVFNIEKNKDKLENNILKIGKNKDRVNYQKLDITDHKQIENIFQNNKIDSVINLAYGIGTICEENPLLASKINIVGTT